MAQINTGSCHITPILLNINEIHVVSFSFTEQKYVSTRYSKCAVIILFNGNVRERQTGQPRAACRTRAVCVVQPWIIGSTVLTYGRKACISCSLNSTRMHLAQRHKPKVRMWTSVRRESLCIGLHVSLHLKALTRGRTDHFVNILADHSNGWARSFGWLLLNYSFQFRSA